MKEAISRLLLQSYCSRADSLSDKRVIKARILVARSTNPTNSTSSSSSCRPTRTKSAGRRRRLIVAMQPRRRQQSLLDGRVRGIHNRTSCCCCCCRRLRVCDRRHRRRKLCEAAMSTVVRAMWRERAPVVKCDVVGPGSARPPYCTSHSSNLNSLQLRY